MIHCIIYCLLTRDVIIVHIQCWWRHHDDSTLDVGPLGPHSAPPVPPHQVSPRQGGLRRQTWQSLEQQQQTRIKEQQQGNGLGITL